jgi:uncharacterized membrane protein
MTEEHPPNPDPASKNIQAIAALERDALHDRTALDRLTDAITRAAGSPFFVAIHVIAFAAWLAFNSLSANAVDPYPYSLLTLLVSLEAIVLSAFVLMSQNRMTRQADKRAHLDLQVNILAEQELTAILRMVHALCKQAGVNVKVRDVQVEQLLQETDIHRIAVEVDEELTNPKPSSPETTAAKSPAAAGQPDE